MLEGNIEIFPEMERLANGYHIFMLDSTQHPNFLVSAVRWKTPHCDNVIHGAFFPQLELQPGTGDLFGQPQ